MRTAPIAAAMLAATCLVLAGPAAALLTTSVNQGYGSGVYWVPGTDEIDYSYPDAGPFTAQGIAHADYGLLQAFATGSVSAGGAASYLSAAEAMWFDLIIIAPRPGLTVSGGYVQFHFNVSGLLSATGAGATAAAQVGLNSTVGESSFDWTSDLLAGAYGLDSTLMPIVMSEATPFALKLYAAATLDGTAAASPYSATATVDYLHTVTLTGISVFDDAQNPLAAGDYTYRFDSQGVPVPGTLALLVGGLAWFGVGRSRFPGR